MEAVISFPSGTIVKFITEHNAIEILHKYDSIETIIITDYHIAVLYPALIQGRKTIIIPAGEESKNFDTINDVVQQLLQYNATRNAMLIGIGGGVITDITGFVASVYMRGIKFGFIPTSLLGMVDAAIGGKNGINCGLQKNILGTINQPEFIAIDTAFLHTLPVEEWSNGFAEIIKYACLKDASLFAELGLNNLEFYRNNFEALTEIITKCVTWKTEIVLADEHETGQRKWLNFGHTAAHAIEKRYELPHGKAVAIGMVIACKISEQVTGLSPAVTESHINLLQNYNLPYTIIIDPIEVMKILINDKKRNNNTIDYILLNTIGKPAIVPLEFEIIEKTLASYAGHH